MSVIIRQACHIVKIVDYCNGITKMLYCLLLTEVICQYVILKLILGKFVTRS